MGIGGNIEFLNEMIEEFGDVKITELKDILTRIKFERFLVNSGNASAISDFIEFEESMEKVKNLVEDAPNF